MNEFRKSYSWEPIREGKGYCALQNQDITEETEEELSEEEEDYSEEEEDYFEESESDEAEESDVEKESQTN